MKIELSTAQIVLILTALDSARDHIRQSGANEDDKEFLTGLVGITQAEFINSEELMKKIPNVTKRLGLIFTDWDEIQNFKD